VRGEPGHGRIRWIIPLFLLPALAFYTAFFVYPAVDAFRISRYDWSGFGGDKVVVGGENFREALTDPFVHRAVLNSFTIMLAGGVVLFALALYFAVVLTHPGVKWKRVLRTGLFFPYAINEVGVAFLWIFILNPQFGLLNGSLKALGLARLAQPWLGSPDLALGCITWVIIWMQIGFYVILLQAGIENISQEVFEAARIDGAGGFSLFRHITLPLLRPVLAVAVTYWMIQSLKIFGIAYALTKGAPAGKTHTIATYVVSVAFPDKAMFRFGYGSAIAVLHFVLIVVLSAVFLRFVRSRQEVS
jgi:ABC-type sugar transport system permease subunit